MLDALASTHGVNHGRYGGWGKAALVMGSEVQDAPDLPMFSARHTGITEGFGV